ncbi:MAG: NRDE family protein [Bacteroidales bacterium]|nr:NRDE family protein [Bacteroidales bacterium]
MCLIIFSYKNHPKYKLILASNRDEFYDRPASALSWWDGEKKVLAGKDKQSDGTWLGITPDLRLAAITNYRDLKNIKENAPSRGLLVRNFLESDETPLQYLNNIKEKGAKYNGFNLIVGNESGLYYYSNVSNKIEKIEAGLHGLSNKFLNTPWPKVEKGKNELEKIIKQKEPSVNEILDLLGDTSRPPDNQLPDTGVGLDLERVLSPIFIKSEVYGTRASSIILIDNEDKVTFIEKSYIKNSTGGFEKNTQIIHF